MLLFIQQDHGRFLLFLKTDFEFSAFPPYKPDGQAKCFVDDHTDIGIGLNAASKNPEESKIFLEWLTSAEFAEIFANEVPGFPLRIQLMNDPVAKEFISWKDDCDTTIRNSVHIVDKLGISSMEVVSGVVNGTMSPEDAGTKGSKLANWYAPHQ